MIDRIKKHLQEGIEQVLTDNIASIVVGVVLMLVAKYNIPWFSDESISTSTKVFVTTLIIAIIYLTCMLYNIRPNRYSFHIKKLNIFFEYDGDTVLVKQTITFRPNRFKAAKMHTSRTWFSDEEYQLKALTRGYSIEKYRKLGDETEYYIVFPKPMHFWQTGTVVVQFEGTNKKRQFENFYWYTIDCPTDSLVIEVRMPTKYFRGKAKAKTFYINEHSHSSKSWDIDFDGRYVWTVPEHRVKWNCVFEWSWSENEQKKIQARKRGSKKKTRKG